jgi:serine protease
MKCLKIIPLLIFLSGFVTHGQPEYAPDRVIVVPRSGPMAPVDRLVGITHAGINQIESMPYTRTSVLDISGTGLTVEQAIVQLSSTGFYEIVEPDYFIRLEAENTPNDTYLYLLWGMTDGVENSGYDINAPTAWSYQTGSSSVIVAVIDSGVDYNHPDLTANIWRNPGEVAANGIDDDGNGYVDDIRGIDAAYNDSDPMDDQGHGTHCAGTIGAVGNNGTGVVGVCWNISILPMKFMQWFGADYGGYTSDAIECFNYLLALKQAGHNVRVTSNSWGGGGYSSSLKNAIDACGSNGIIHAMAAGNDSLNNDVYPHYPSNYTSSSIISVASHTSSGNYSYFSNYGATSVDISAPGSSIYSTRYGTSSYVYMSGTSMATPHVAGALGLLFSEDNGLSVSEAKSAILNNARTNANMANTTVTGGMLDIAAALESISARPEFTAPDQDEEVANSIPLAITWTDNGSSQDFWFLSVGTQRDGTDLGFFHLSGDTFSQTITTPGSVSSVF